jgi:predicted transcriptional regulator
MPRPPSTLPTTSELAILNVIWQRGPSTVREVYRTLAADREMGYSTVLKFMQIMTEKGSLTRDERVRPQVYRAARPRRATQRFLVRDLISRVFGGSSATLVMQALADQRATPDERRRIRELLDSLDGKGGRAQAPGRVTK